MAVSKEIADHVLEALNGYQTTEAINAACKLELFDEIHEQENVTVQQLVAEKSWNESFTQQLLNILVSLKMLSKTLNSDGKYLYQNTEHGNLLCRYRTPSLWGNFLLCDFLKEKYGSVYDLVKGTKRASHHHHHHNEAPSENQSEEKTHKPLNPWMTHCHGDGDDESRRIDMANAKAGFLDVYLDQVLSQFDFSSYKTVVDLGGGSGNVARALCRKYRNMHVIVVDKDHVIETARKVHSLQLEKDETLNVEFMAGDFCEMEIPQADLYVMSQVAHHLSDDEWNKTISTVYTKLPRGGAFMLLESFLTETGDGPIAAQMFQLLITGNGHFINTVEGFKSSLHTFGFSDVKSVHIGGRCAHGIICAWK